MAITFKSFGSSQIEIDSASISERSTIRDIVDSLEAMTPGIKARILDETGQPRRFLNIYINSEDIRFLNGLDTPIQDGDELSIVPAIAGGFDPAVSGGSIDTEEENIEEENIKYTRIMIVMERSFQEFGEQQKVEFLKDLSMISGCLDEDFRGISFRNGCVIFEAKIPEESVERILELWEFIQNQGNSDIEATLKVYPDDLKEIEEFINKHTISRIKGNINTPYPIVKKSGDNDPESKAIIFVHGWTGNKNSFGKMPEFLCESEEFNCSNEIYSYPTSWIEGKSIVFISRNLDNWIRRKRKKNGYQKLAFVAHSMGGLVVKKFLVNQVCRDRPVTGYIKEITFIATPHNGAVLAKIPKLIPGLKTDQVRELAAGSPFLVDLNEQWSAWTRLFVPEFCRYGSIFGTDDEVVDTTNTPDKDLETAYILGAKHVDIVKPETPDDEVVATVIDFLQEANF